MDERPTLKRTWAFILFACVDGALELEDHARRALSRPPQALVHVDRREVRSAARQGEGWQRTRSALMARLQGAGSPLRR